MTITHEDLMTLAMNTLAALDVHSAEFAKAGVDVDAAVQDLSRHILEEEAAEADGCLRHLPGSQRVRSPSGTFPQYASPLSTHAALSSPPTPREVRHGGPFFRGKSRSRADPRRHRAAGGGRPPHSLMMRR